MNLHQTKQKHNVVPITFRPSTGRTGRAIAKLLQSCNDTDLVHHEGWSQKGKSQGWIYAENKGEWTEIAYVTLELVSCSCSDYGGFSWAVEACQLASGCCWTQPSNTEQCRPPEEHIATSAGLPVREGLCLRRLSHPPAGRVSDGRATEW